MPGSPAVFGLVHGFGFAAVLKELGLPITALGWSLFSFNFGVEIGQLGIVLVVASLLAAIRRRSEPLDRQLVFAGSVIVMLAGGYWFVATGLSHGRRVMKRGVVLGLLVAVGAGGMTVAAQQAQQPPQPLTIEKVKDNLYVIIGGGGNTAAYIIAKGVVLVDTKLANYGQPILDKVKSVTDKPITHIINTHTHGDHVGSNEFFPATVEIVAHENTAANMAKMQNVRRTRRPSTAAGQDVQGQDDAALRERVDRSVLLRPAHTDGDAFVVFRNLRVMHAGDAFAGPSTPIMDVNNGGSGVDYPGTLAKAAAGIKNVER